MSQFDFGTINPDAKNGTELASDLNSWRDAVMTNNSGATDPTVTYPFMPFADVTNDLFKIRNGTDTDWVSIFVLSTGQVITQGVLPDSSVTNAQLASDAKMPTGTILYVAQNTAPTGFLKANGAIISRTTYATLFSVIGTTFGAGDGTTTFALPDLRGEFIRAWDDSRGVDSGRTFGSAQSDDFKSHNHTLAAGLNTVTPAGSGTNTYMSNTGTNTGSTGGIETRPRNVALLACIRY